MYFENSFVIVLIGGLEFPPPVYIHGVLKLVFESLDFGLLVEKVLFLETDFSLELIDAPDLFFDTHELVSLIGQIGPHVVELLLFFLVINFSLGEVGIGEFDLFI